MQAPTFRPIQANPNRIGSVPKSPKYVPGSPKQRHEFSPENIWPTLIDMFGIDEAKNQYEIVSKMSPEDRNHYLMGFKEIYNRSQLSKQDFQDPTIEMDALRGFEDRNLRQNISPLPGPDFARERDQQIHHHVKKIEEKHHREVTHAKKDQQQQEEPEDIDREEEAHPNEQEDQQQNENEVEVNEPSTAIQHDYSNNRTVNEPPR